VRDHWLEVLYGVDAVSLRSHDLERYHQLSRVVTGRIMARVFDEWRSPENPCGGGLVWFLQDLRPGAGWGIIDADNEPKAAYYYLMRAWQPVGLTLLDRGLDGLVLEVHNETGSAVEAEVTVSMIDAGGVTTARAATTLAVPPRGTAASNVEGLLGRFADPTYSYRFGPLGHRAVAAVASFGPGIEPRSVVYWPRLSEELNRGRLVADTADTEDGQGGHRLTVTADGLTREVRVDWPGRHAEDN
jgi:beta-mannosidase